VVYESNHFRTICTKRRNGVERHQVQHNTKSPDNTPTRYQSSESKIPFRRGFLARFPTGEIWCLFAIDLFLLPFSVGIYNGHGVAVGTQPNRSYYKTTAIWKQVAESKARYRRMYEKRCINWEGWNKIARRDSTTGRKITTRVDTPTRRENPTTALFSCPTPQPCPSIDFLS
jgi:hypothetical protein